jgi:peroxiredoxin
MLIEITGAYAQLAPGTKAPNFKLASSAGDTVSLEKLKGKIVIIHFWHVG